MQHPPQTVELYAPLELAFQVAQPPANPYRQARVQATLIPPTGGERHIPLFYDGDGIWRMRVAPGVTGEWTYRLWAEGVDLSGPHGTFQCVQGQHRGGLQPMKDYPYHFSRQDGTPVFWMGDTNWRAFATDPEKKMDREAFCHYVDVRAAQGFTYIHADVMGSAGEDGGQNVFTDYAQEEINVAFFQEMDERVRYMNARGITCGIVLGWGTGATSWASFPSEEARLRYARYIVGRYSAYDVVLVVAAEWDLGGIDKEPWYRTIGREIRRSDPHRRMCTIHTCHPRTVRRFVDEPWMSFGDYQQLYCAPKAREATAEERAAMRAHLLAARVHGRPVVNAEYAYYLRSMWGQPHNYVAREGIRGVDKEHSHTRASFRRASWALVMAGGYFVSGFGSTYFGGWRENGPFDVDAPKNDDGEADLAHLKRFFTSLEWWRLAPLDTLVRADAGNAWCLADLGRTYVVYSEGATRLTLDLALLKETPFSAELYDPRTDTFRPLPDPTPGEPYACALPDAQDWVVLLRRRGGEA